jgi:sulfide:quinone oxidoreductase
MNARRAATNVLIAGGGVAALEAALALRALAQHRVAVELLAPEPAFWYRPLAVAEPFGLAEVKHFGLPELAAAAGAVFTLGALASVDTGRRIAHTSAGMPIPFDMLVVATGARPESALPGAVTFRGPADGHKIDRLLAEVASGEVRRVVFAVPAGAVWSLPAYELALLTAQWAESHGVSAHRVVIATPEERPLAIFGPEVSDAVRDVLAQRGVGILTNVYPLAVRDRSLVVLGGRTVDADRVVAVPRLRAQAIAGVPQDPDGFVQVDEHGRVAGLSNVYAAGDVTTFPVKQGGIAAQQADAVAEAIAEAAGADRVARPFRPVLEAVLLSGDGPRFIRHELSRGADSTVSEEPLWSPPAKIVGKYLAPFLERNRSAPMPT